MPRSRASPSLELTEEDLDRLAAFAGLRGVEGQGIVIEIDGSFDPTAVNDLIYELRNAGAEAIAVDDVRITASSVAVLGTGAIEIDGVAHRPRVHDQRHRLAARACGRRSSGPGGILTLLQQSIDAVFTVEEAHEPASSPARERDLTPQVARPVE